MPSALSIIFIHKGNSWYLPYTLWQCRQTNPQAEIYLISDSKTKQFNGIAKHIEISKYERQTEKIRSVYKHHSSLGLEFELTCLERWFILLAFLTEKHIENCVYLDSDILVYSDLMPFADKFSTCDMTWYSYSAHTNFINSISALENYCNNIIDLYTDRFPEQLKGKSYYYQVLSGKLNLNISDMTFFHDYNLRYPGSLLVITEPNTSGNFDISMEDTLIFASNSDGFKQIQWKNNIPFACLKETGDWLPFITLHFQGKAKKILKEHFMSGNLKFRFLNLYFMTLFLFQRFFQKFKILVLQTRVLRMG